MVVVVVMAVGSRGGGAVRQHRCEGRVGGEHGRVRGQSSVETGLWRLDLLPLRVRHRLLQLRRCACAGEQAGQVGWQGGNGRRRTLGHLRLLSRLVELLLLLRLLHAPQKPLQGLCIQRSEQIPKVGRPCAESGHGGGLLLLLLLLLRVLQRRREHGSELGRVERLSGVGGLGHGGGDDMLRASDELHRHLWIDWIVLCSRKAQSGPLSSGRRHEHRDLPSNRTLASPRLRSKICSGILTPSCAILATVDTANTPSETCRPMTGPTGMRGLRTVASVLRPLSRKIFSR